MGYRVSLISEKKITKAIDQFKNVTWKKYQMIGLESPESAVVKSVE